MTLKFLQAAQNSVGLRKENQAMIIERNVFHLKFGKAKEAKAMWVEYLDMAKKKDPALEARLLTDLTGTSYTLILELHIRSFVDITPIVVRMLGAAEWRTFYDKFIPLCETASRSLYKIESIV